MGAVEPQPAGGAHLRQARVGGPGVGGLGCLALEAEHHGLDRAVPVAGGAERAEQLGPHPAHLLEQAGGAQAPAAKVCAARIGPTVCELEGPMPTEKRSNALMAIAAQCVRSRALADIPDTALSWRFASGVGGTG